MKRTFTKIRNKICKCKFCEKEFLAAEPRAKVCDACKISPEKLGKCEVCSTPVKKGDRFCSPKCKATYGHFLPGSKMGFQSGNQNIAKDPEIRKKISGGIRKSYEDENLIKCRREKMIELARSGKAPGWYSSYNEERKERYQSRLEESFATLLQEKKAPYIKDYPLPLEKGKTKLIDFYLLERNHFVEISGFAYERWQKDFIQKLLIIDSLYSGITIIIFTYKDKLPKLREMLFPNISEKNNWGVFNIDQFEDYIKGELNNDNI